MAAVEKLRAEEAADFSKGAAWVDGAFVPAAEAQS